MFAGRADPVDLVGDRLQPGPAVLVGEGMAGAHLGDIAGGMKLVAILVMSSRAVRPACRRWCSCPIRTRPSRSAHTALRSRHQLTKILRQARPDPPARRFRRWNVRGSPAGPRRRTRGSGSRACPAPLTSNSISRQEAERRQGQRDPRHERLDMGLGHADHPALGLLDGGIAGKQRGGMAVGADAQQHDIEQRPGRIEFGPRRRTISARSRSGARPRRDRRCRSRIGWMLAAGAQRSRKASRAIAILFSGSPAGTKRSSPMNQCTRSHGIRLR